MEWIQIIEYIMYAAITIGVGVLVKFLRDKGWIDELNLSDDVKRTGAELAVLFAQQVYENLDGQMKYDAAAEYLADYLTERGIEISKSEIKLLIESAVKKMKHEFGDQW